MDVTRDPHKTAYSVREQMHEESTECTSNPVHPILPQNRV
jgi:hypothetical protein